MSKKGLYGRYLYCFGLFMGFWVVDAQTGGWPLRITAIGGMAACIAMGFIARQDYQLFQIKDAHIHQLKRRAESQSEQIAYQDEMLALYRQRLGRDL